MIMGQIYFQHDGAHTHYTWHVKEYLHESFHNCWLGHVRPLAWPPRSPHRTLCDYCVWGHMKALVYETKVDSRAALRHHIFAAAKHLRNHPDIVSATQSLLKHAEKCVATRGGHLEQLLSNRYFSTGNSIPNCATSVLLDVHVLCQVLGHLRMTSWKDGEFF